MFETVEITKTIEKISQANNKTPTEILTEELNDRISDLQNIIEFQRVRIDELIDKPIVETVKTWHDKIRHLFHL